MSNDSFLEALWAVSPEPEPLEDVPAWWARHTEATAALEDPFARAVVGAAHADRPAYAFASGYVSALQRMVPSLGRAAAALCATEVGGAHPRAILAQLVQRGDGLIVHGEKAFVTLGQHAEQLLVVAREGERDGRPALALARIPRGAEGVSLEALSGAPFVPEVPHVSARFDSAPVAERLPGDGYADYLKPFRSVEDVFVHAALLAWLVQVARRRWPEGVVEEGLALICASAELARQDPRSPVTHRALGGLLAQANAWIESLDPRWASTQDDARARWERDRALLGVAGKARAQRLHAARREG